MACMFAKMGNKVAFICGEINIHILDPNKQKNNKQFYQHHVQSVFPKITRPTRITTYGPMLIDHLYTNDMDNKATSGIIINDISDHLPVFIIYDGDYRNKKVDKQTEYRRIIKLLKNELLK